MTQPTCKRPEFYDDKIVLAPMVRQSNLPFRLLCLDYGADLVYSEELIDYKLSKCRRVENRVLKTVDFLDEQGDVVLRVEPSEKDRFIVQIGSNNFDRFIKAAKLVARDCSGIDFNFGCPKRFSIAGGMGAAMLEKPDQIRELLTRSVESLALPITCKIRILPELQQTLDLVRMIESCGVSAVAVHGRTKEQRSHGPCSNEVLREISKVLTVPLIANGGSNDMKSYSDILKFKAKTNASSVMVARCAMRNASIFRPDNCLEPIENVIRAYLKLAVRYDNTIAQTKYTLQTMLGAGHFGPELCQRFHGASSHEELCDIFELSEWYAKNRLTASRGDFYGPLQVTLEDRLEDFLRQRRAALAGTSVKELVVDSVPYNSVKRSGICPKARLVDHTNKLHPAKPPQFEIVKLEGQKKNEFYCAIVYENVFYFNKSSTSGKRNAEHATSVLVLRKLGLASAEPPAGDN